MRRQRLFAVALLALALVTGSAQFVGSATDAQAGNVAAAQGQQVRAFQAPGPPGTAVKLPPPTMRPSPPAQTSKAPPSLPGPQAHPSHSGNAPATVKATQIEGPAVTQASSNVTLFRNSVANAGAPEQLLINEPSTANAGN